MADLLESISTLLQELTGGGRPRMIISPAPGGGPESGGEDLRKQIEVAHNGRLPLGYLAAVPRKGNDTVGFGGPGDPVVVDEHYDDEVKAAIAEAIRIANHHKPVLDANPEGRVRMGQWYWLEGHSDQTVGPVVGAYSLFDGSTGAPSAGNSLVTIPISVPAGTVSPIFLLDRYPGAFYMSLFVSSFAFLPTAGTTTGIQECWFTDIGGAVAGLGIYPAATGSPGIQNINKQCSSPLTDPGLNTLGNLVINNIGIGGTPVAARWQLSIGYIAFFADPWFNKHMLMPRVPAKFGENYERSLGAQGF